MRRPEALNEHSPPATPGTSCTNKTDEISGANASQNLSANHAIQRSPSPFEASTTHRSRNNSVDAGSTTQGDLYDATPARELEPPRLLVSSPDTPDEDDSLSDADDDDVTYGINHMNLGLSDDDGHGSTEEDDISATLDELDFNQHADSSNLNYALYSMRDEQLPAEPYYEEGFQTALKQGTQLAGQVATCLEGCPAVCDPDSSLHKLNQEALMLSEYKSPTTRTIAIIGKSGSGKSSLINSLLHVDELALTGSAGTAVTAFATEYRYQPTHNAPKFTVIAYCLNAEEIDENLGELLEDFRKPYLIHQTELTAEEFKAAEDRSDAAKTIFETAFGRIDDFHIEKVAYEEGGYERAFECLKQWARHLKWPAGTHDGKWEASAKSENKLQRKMVPFFSLGLWPFVKKVVIYLNSPILRNGLVLADLPGYHDVNFARVAAAKKFQSTCDEIFVVTDIKRGVDDPIIKEVIDEMSSAAGVGKITRPNITVICSHAGELGSAQDIRKLKRMVPASKIKHAQKQIDKVGRREGRFKDAELAFKQAKMNMNELLIRARNQEVKCNLQAKYSDHFLPRPMPVFCIDNAYYQEQGFPQAVDLSGIRDLRRYCLSLPGRALFRSADAFLETRLPALANSLDIWLDAARSAGTQAFSNLVDAEKLHNTLDSLLGDWKADFERKCKERLVNPSKNGEASILADACETCDSWNRMHHASYRAWVRNDGTHTTKTVGRKCWNTELVASLNHVLASYWISLDSEGESDLGAVSDQMQDHLENFRKVAKDARAPESLVQNLTARQRLVEIVFADGIEGFMRSFRLIKHNATSGNSTSFMLAYMRPIYKVGGIDTGAGVTDRNRRMIHQHVADSNFVTSHSRRICDDLKELAERTVESLLEKVHSILDATDADLETIQAPDAALLEKYPAFGKRVEEMLRTARTDLESIEVAARGAREDARRRGYI